MDAGGSTATRIVGIPVETRADGQILVGAKIGGRPGRFSIDTTIPGPEVQPQGAPDRDSAFVSAAETTVTTTGVTHKVEHRVTNGFGLGDDASFWTPLRRATTNVSDLGIGDGLLNPRMIPSRRIVLDYPRGELRYEIPTVDEAIGFTISRLTSFDIRVQGERLVFGPPLAPDADAVRPKLIGAELIEYEGMPAADLLAAMRVGGERRLRVLAKLSRAIAFGFKGKILLNAKTIDLDATPSD